MTRLLVALLLAAAGDASAMRVESLVVTHSAGVFAVDAVLVLAASPAAVRAALTDFNHLTRLSPAILESRVLRVTPEGTLVFTRSRGCAGWFCRELRKTELITLGDGTIHAEAVADDIVGKSAGTSTVAHSVTDWRIVAVGDTTRLELRSVVDPAFFVPPLVGPALIKKAMLLETEQLARGLERAARALAPAAAPDAAPDADG